MNINYFLNFRTNYLILVNFEIFNLKFKFIMENNTKIKIPYSSLSSFSNFK